MLENAIKARFKIYVATTSILEAYNVLHWFYRVRPRTALLQKLSAVVDTMVAVAPSLEGVGLSLRENIPLGDGFLLATALSNKIPVVVSNDTHIAKVAPKIGLIVENPLTETTKRRLSSVKSQ